MDTSSPLLTDLYELNMVEAYLDRGMTDTAVFEFFVRNLPVGRGFLIAAGLEQALDFLERLRFSPEDLDWLTKTRRFSKDVIDYLADLQFTGDVDAMAEGTAFFPDEPILRVVAPLPVAQLVETRLINLLHFQTVIASKAARFARLAPAKLLVDFGLRRAHGSEAGLLAARASYIAGFAGTATVLANALFGIPIYGTMAHSFVQAFDDEAAAFEAFARSRPKDLVLLLDTYDTEAAAKKVIALYPALRASGLSLAGVRLDSGDLIALSRSVRRILDAGGLGEVTIFASGGIDEEELAAMERERAPIDGYGIGTSLTTSSDRPSLDCAYKLQEYAGVARRKRSPGKATWPGRKQVWRRYGKDGRMAGDILSLEHDRQEGDPLLVPVMRGGRRTGPNPALAQLRQRAEREMSRMPEPLRSLSPGATVPVRIADALRDLAATLDRRTTGRRT
jgi:nicotinate phosphoribosyltransferase